MLNFYFCEFTMLLTKQILFSSNRPKFPSEVEITGKSEESKNSKKLSRLQIKEREQVSKKEKRFNVGKAKKDLQYFQRICQDTLFISKNAQFRPKLPPPLTLGSKRLINLNGKALACVPDPIRKRHNVFFWSLGHRPTSTNKSAFTQAKACTQKQAFNVNAALFDVLDW